MKFDIFGNGRLSTTAKNIVQNIFQDKSSLGRDECLQWMHDRQTEIAQVREFYREKLRVGSIDYIDFQMIMSGLDHLSMYIQKGNPNPDHYDDLPLNQEGLLERKKRWVWATNSVAEVVNDMLQDRL